jgi:hypothetical protein
MSNYDYDDDEDDFNEFETPEMRIEKKIIENHKILDKYKKSLPFDADQKEKNYLELMREHKNKELEENFILKCDLAEKKLEEGKYLTFLEVDLLLKRNYPLFDIKDKDDLKKRKHISYVASIFGYCMSFIFSSFVFTSAKYIYRDRIGKIKKYAITGIITGMFAYPVFQYIERYKRKILIGIVERNKAVILNKDNYYMKERKLKNEDSQN